MHTTRALDGDGAGSSLVAWAVALLALAAWLGWFFFGRVQVIEATGRARLEVGQAAHAVNAPVAGTVVRAVQPLGTPVRRGDVLLELDTGSLALRWQEERTRRLGLIAQASALRQEIAALEHAAALDRQTGEAAVDGARWRTDEAAVASDHAAQSERRLRAESDAGSVARVEAEQAATEALRLAAAHQALGAEVRRVDADTRTRLARQQAQAEALRRQLAALEAEAATASLVADRLALDIAHHQVRAPVDGVIGSTTPLRVGEYVSAGQALATVIPAGDFVAVAEFEPAAVLGRVHPGQPARLRLDGFPWAQYGTVAATVSRVAGEIRDNRVRVEFTPDAAWPAGIRLQHGLPGTMEITLESVAPAVLVLRSAGMALGGGLRP